MSRPCQALGLEKYGNTALDQRRKNLASVPTLSFLAVAALEIIVLQCKLGGALRIVRGSAAIACSSAVQRLATGSTEPTAMRYRLSLSIAKDTMATG
jgi:hypothetical protein